MTSLLAHWLFAVTKTCWKAVPEPWAGSHETSVPKVAVGSLDSSRQNATDDNLLQTTETNAVLLSSAQVISHCENRAHPHPDSHRFEKISNIIKQFKLSCSKVSSNFTSMEVRNSMFAAYIDGFTTNTYVMVIMSDPSIREFLYSA